MSIKRIVVVGAGPAGMIAAIRASTLNQDVTLIEKNPLPGRKLLLSGKGRCNLTNQCELDEFLSRFSLNSQFLRDAFKKFFYPQLMDFFEKRGLALKVERQMRVFPVTDRSASILEVLEKELVKCKVHPLFKTEVKDILVEEGQVRGVLCSGGKVIEGEKVILSTGGISYRFTGSSGDGFRIAEKLGHSIKPLKPGLVPLATKEKFVRKLRGLVLKNIRLNFSNGKKEITSEIGELLFTDFGISGPLVLSLSGRVSDLLEGQNKVTLKVDLKPALTNEQLEARLLREFSLNSKKSLKNVLKELLPQSFIEVFLNEVKIDLEKSASHVTAEERKRLVRCLKAFPLEIAKTLPIEEAMVTRGGVSLKEINPRTMESRLIKGLYFAGEIIDVDADTGGFNLQAAFSTGYLAGESAALS